MSLSSMYLPLMAGGPFSLEVAECLIAVHSLFMLVCCNCTAVCHSLHLWTCAGQYSWLRVQGRASGVQQVRCAAAGGVLPVRCHGP